MMAFAFLKVKLFCLCPLGGKEEQYFYKNGRMTILTQDTWGNFSKDPFFLLNKCTAPDQGASHTRVLRDSVDEIVQHVCWLLRMGKYTKRFSSVHFNSVTQSCPTLRPHEPQHIRLPCLSPTPGFHPNSCPLSWWCHTTISSSIVPFFSCPQSFPASGSFHMGQLFTSGGQNIGVSASTSVLSMNTQDWSPLGWTGWISLQSRDSHESSPTPQFKSINSLALSFLQSPTLTSIHDHRKKHSLD